MKRPMILVAALVLLLMASPAMGLAPSVSLTTPSGPAGTTTGITILDFDASTPFEIRLGGYGGTVLKTGTTNTAGDAINTITIPVGTAPGPVTIAVCQQTTACTDTGNEFWVGASATFTVTGTTETTATTAATDTTGTTGTTAGTTGSSIPLRAVPAETCVAGGSWGSTAAPLATPGDAIVMTFDEYGSSSYESPHAIDAIGNVDVTTTPTIEDGGVGFFFGSFEYATTSSTTRAIVRGPYSGIPTRILTPPVLATVSPPNVAASDGINGQTFSILGDYEIAYVGLHLGGYEAIPGTEFDVTFSVNVSHLPARLEDGTIVTAELGSGAITLTIGPEDIPVNRCIVVGLDFTAWRAAGGDAFELVEPAPGAVVILRTEITRGGAGLGGPADMPVFIDNVFFAILREETASTTTITTSAASSPTTVAAAPAGDDPGPSSMTLFLVGGAVVLGLLGTWVLLRPHPRGPKRGG